MAETVVFAFAGMTVALAKPLPPPTTGMVEAAMAFHYSELAHKAGDIDSARIDLQKAINCLVGRGDRKYRAAAGDRCKSKGNGAIHDIKDAPLREELQLAVGEVTFGIKSPLLRTLHTDALSAMDYMRSFRIEDSYPGPSGP
jgi:hypothetical protein